MDNACKIPEIHVARPVPQLVFRAGGRCFYPTRADNPGADAFIMRISASPAELELCGGEGALGWEPEEERREVNAAAGEVVLLGSGRLAICLEDKKLTCVRLAKLGLSPEELKSVFGADKTKIGIFVEWSE